MRVLFVGGTGNISASVSRLCVERGIELTLLNRGRSETPVAGARHLKGDISRSADVASLLGGQRWDVVVNWIAFTPEDVERDIAFFNGKIGQYVFISSASAYQKPLSHPVVTESTPLSNPYWEYSRQKIACEERLLRAYRDEGFPTTIVRPSLTYDTVIPVVFGGWKEFTIVDRIRSRRKIIVHGDGTSLWTITHAEDFAKGFIGLLGHPQAAGQAFHITSDEVLTWNQIYTTLAAAAGETPEIVHIASDFIVRLEPSLTGSLLGDKATSAIFDNHKIRQFVPGFQAVIPFHKGISMTLAWFERDPARCLVREETHRMMDRIIAAYEHALT
jgi:nucleoside-diphosphate-sugar epimerase